MYIQKKAPSPLAREAAAKQRQDDLHDMLNDPAVIALERVRMIQLCLSDAAVNAERAYRTQNDVVDCPVTGRSRAMHAQRAARLRALMAAEGWSTNPREPIAPVRSLEEFTDEFTAPLRAELVEAEADHLAIEAERVAFIDGGDRAALAAKYAEQRVRRDIANKAEKLFLAQHQPVRCPSSGREGAVHPDRAWVVAGLLDAIQAPDDPTAPLLPEKTVAEIHAELLAEAGLEAVAG